MKLSTKGRYGLRAVIDIAQHGSCELVSISSIAQRQKISESYLEQLVRQCEVLGIGDGYVHQLAALVRAMACSDAL